MPVNIGLARPTFAGPIADHRETARLRAIAERADTLGFDGLWVAEHLLRAPLIFNFVHVVDTDDREKAVRAQLPHYERVMGAHRPLAALEACYLMGTPADIPRKLGRVRRVGVTEFILGPLTSDEAQVELIDELIARPLAAKDG